MPASPTPKYALTGPAAGDDLTELQDLINQLDNLLVGISSGTVPPAAAVAAKRFLETDRSRWLRDSGSSIENVWVPAETYNGRWKRVAGWSGIFSSPTTKPPGQYMMMRAAENWPVANSFGGGPYLFTFDPADYVIAGYTTQLRLTVSLGKDNMASVGAIYDVGLHRAYFTNSGGNPKVNIDPAVSGSIVTPSGSGQYYAPQSSAPFTPPAAGEYVFGINVTDPFFGLGVPGNHDVLINADLQVRHVPS